MTTEVKIFGKRYMHEDHEDNALLHVDVKKTLPYLEHDDAKIWYAKVTAQFSISDELAQQAEAGDLAAIAEVRRRLDARRSWAATTASIS